MHQVSGKRIRYQKQVSCILQQSNASTNSHESGVRDMYQVLGIL